MPGRTPRCIVLAPTRELANQVEREFAASAPTLSVGCFYGGACWHMHAYTQRAGFFTCWHWLVKMRSFRSTYSCHVRLAFSVSSRLY